MCNVYMYNFFIWSICILKCLKYVRLFVIINEIFDKMVNVRVMWRLGDYWFSG